MTYKSSVETKITIQYSESDFHPRCLTKLIIKITFCFLSSAYLDKYFLFKYKIFLKT